MTNELEVECRQKFCRLVEKGNDLLMFRNFLDVLELCNNEIDSVKQYQKHVERSSQVARERETFDNLIHYLATLVESLCILAVQAYAETGQHTEVLPFLKKCYHGIRHCPDKIIQICILMYGKYEDYETAEPVFREWRKFPRNQSLPSYPGILELFIVNILLPQAKYGEAIQYADLDTVLSLDRKIALIKFIKKYEQAINQENQSCISKAGRGTPSDKQGVLFPEAFSNAVKRMGSNIFQRLPFISLTVIRKLAVIAVFVYIILFKTNLDTVWGLSYAGQLWQSVVRLWKSMFAPYHVAATQ